LLACTMNGDSPLNIELQRINISLTQALCDQQSVSAKLNRQLYYAREDLNSARQDLKESDLYVGILEKKLQRLQEQLQQQERIPAPSNWFGQQDPNAYFGHNFASVPPPIIQNEGFLEHRTAGTLLSPRKQGRRPLSVLDDNAPLKLPKRLPKNQTIPKRPPVSSPPAKPPQKRPSIRPTPEKFKESSRVAGEVDRPVKQKALPMMTLSELKKSGLWKVSDDVPNAAACRPLITAIFQLIEGNVTMLQAALEWLVNNVPLCRNTLLQTNTRFEEAAEITENIESWLQHNFNDRYLKKGGTLPLEMDQAKQLICSAALFNRRKMNTDLVRRVLPTIGGKRRLKATKEFNTLLINEEKQFYWPNRKVRKDATWPLLCQFVRRKICWNDKYTKVDTNFSRKIKCKEPIIEAMEGGGFRLTGWKVVEREMRMWYEETKLSDVLNLVINSGEWKQLKTEYPAVSINKNSLRLALCPSVRRPSFRSCVNEKMSTLSYLMEDLHSVVNNNDVLRKRIDECPCRRHRTARDMREMGCDPPLLWHDELRCLPSRFCGLATCPKKEMTALQVEGREPPKLRDKACTKSQCSSCGFAKKMGLGDPECAAFTGCTELMEVTLWEKAARNGDRFQREPTRHTGAERKTVGEVYLILLDEVAPIALEHLGEAQWWHKHIDRKVATFSQDELLIYTDFSATPEFIAKEVGNCHEAEHCVIDVIVVLDDPRTIQVVNKDGEITEKRINSCTYWAFLGPTDGKGKKNDHRFHREALHSVIEFHKKKALQRSIEIMIASLLTDNCSGQYKSQYNLGDVAWFSEKHPGIRLEHCYAPVFEFKGVHDGFGKTVKWKFKEAELKGTRISNAQKGYGYLNEKYAGRRTDWDLLETEKSPKLLQRGPFTMTEVRVGYVADTKDEADCVLETFGGDHILHCDRESVPRTVGDKAAEGLTDVYSVRGKRESILSEGEHHFWELELASRVCFCAICTARDSNSEPCPYHDIRDVRTIVVDDKASDLEWCSEQRAKRAVAIYFRKKKSTGYVNMKQMREELQRIGKPFPSNAKRLDLAFIFLSMQDDSRESEEQQLLAALDDEIQNPPNPSLDDNADADDGNEQELPISEEEAPTDIDQLLIDDIEEESTGQDYSIADEELKLLSNFSSLSDTILLFQLSQRRLSTAGSRADQEERLREAVRPF